MMIVIVLSLWFLVTGAFSDIMAMQQRTRRILRAPLYRSEFVFGLLGVGRLLWGISLVVIVLYNWRLLIGLLIASILLGRLVLDALVERFVLIPLVKLLLIIFGRGHQQDSEEPVE